MLDELPDLLASAPEIPSIAGAEEPLDEDHEVPLGEACGSDGSSEPQGVPTGWATGPAAPGAVPEPAMSVATSTRESFLTAALSVWSYYFGRDGEQG